MSESGYFHLDRGDQGMAREQIIGLLRQAEVRLGRGQTIRSGACKERRLRKRTPLRRS